ncbi:hypothetical protein Q2941_45460 [Bradyrhizobium sp. UFLA05-153]
MRPLFTALSFFALFVFQISEGDDAQGFQPDQIPLQHIRVDPIFGPIQGLLGEGRCQDFRRFLLIEQVASQTQVQEVAFHPSIGPICDGPLGQAPCQVIRRYLAMQQLAPQQYPLQQIGTLPRGTALCMGPLGPGPCDAIGNYLMQQNQGGAGLQSIDPARPQLVNTGTTVQPMCNGPHGTKPCYLVPQMSFDGLSGQVPSPGAFGVASGGDPQRTAIECAKRVGLDVSQFAGCVGQQIILPQSQQGQLDSAVSSRSASFASCAAPHLGIQLSDNQRILAKCAMRSNGDRAAFHGCAGGSFANRKRFGLSLRGETSDVQEWGVVPWHVDFPE